MSRLTRILMLAFSFAVIVAGVFTAWNITRAKPSPRMQKVVNYSGLSTTALYPRPFARSRDMTYLCMVSFGFAGPGDDAIARGDNGIGVGDTM
jgi:hypothetical protein